MGSTASSVCLWRPSFRLKHPDSVVSRARRCTARRFRCTPHHGVRTQVQTSNARKSRILHRNPGLVRFGVGSAGVAGAAHERAGQVKRKPVEDHVAPAPSSLFSDTVRIWGKVRPRHETSRNCMPGCRNVYRCAGFNGRWMDERIRRRVSDFLFFGGGCCCRCCWRRDCCRVFFRHIQR